MADTGLFGGTFNPVHNGHLRLAEAAREQFDLETVRFIPARIPPHKSFSEDIPDAERIRLLQLGIGNNAHFSLDDLELHRPGPSYTIRTIELLEEKYPDNRFFFIIGEDHLPGLHNWRDFALLRSKVIFLVAPRSEQPERVEEQIRDLDCDCRLIRTSPLPISSSEIRQRLKEGRSIRYLVPEAVRQYVEEKEFYR